MKLKLERMMHYSSYSTTPTDHTIMVQYEYSFSPLATCYKLHFFSPWWFIWLFRCYELSLCARACVRVTHDSIDWFILPENLTICTVPLPFGNPISKQSYVGGCSFFFPKQGLKPNICIPLCSIVAFLSCLYITKNQNRRELQSKPWSRAYHSITRDKSRHRIDLLQVTESLTYSIAWYSLTYTSIRV